MPTLELSYFDFNGGRGEPIRLALAIGGIPFEDHRVKGADWPALKPTTPFGGLPVLTVDGRAISQSNGILRFVGKLAGLYPTDALQALLCDEVMSFSEDVSHLLAPTMGLKDPEELRARRVALADGPLSTALVQLQRRLEAAGGEWFADGRLTVADLKIFGLVRYLSSGRLDHIPVDLVLRIAPKLRAHHERVRAVPGVARWHAAHGVTA